MFEGYRTENQVLYVDVMEENATMKATIHNFIYAICRLYGTEQNASGGMTVLAGDQQILRTLFWTFYGLVDMHSNYTPLWYIPIPGGFHSEKSGIVEILTMLM